MQSSSDCATRGISAGARQCGKPAPMIQKNCMLQKECDPLSRYPERIIGRLAGSTLFASQLFRATIHLNEMAMRFGRFCSEK